MKTVITKVYNGFRFNNNGVCENPEIFLVFGNSWKNIMGHPYGVVKLAECESGYNFAVDCWCGNAGCGCGVEHGGTLTRKQAIIRGIKVLTGYLKEFIHQTHYVSEIDEIKHYLSICEQRLQDETQLELF